VHARHVGNDGRDLVTFGVSTDELTRYADRWRITARGYQEIHRQGDPTGFPRTCPRRPEETPMTTDADVRRDLVDQYFARQNAMDLDGWLAQLTDDVKVPIPFAPADFPHVNDGKQPVADIYRDLLARCSALHVDVHEVQPALDPGFATGCWHTHADLTTGGAYANDLIGTFRFRDARISEVAECFNTIEFREAIK
jgi:ketosteroid isomerase-like protein